jgi:hypothetical protein
MRQGTKILLLLLPLFAISQSEIGDKLAGFIKSGNDSQLKTYFDQSVEILTPDHKGVYSQNQAQQVIKSFFNKYPCSSFKVDHNGNSAGGSRFLIGTYESGSHSFRTSIFLKQSGEKFLIQELSFEE